MGSKTKRKNKKRCGLPPRTVALIFAASSIVFFVLCSVVIGLLDKGSEFNFFVALGSGLKDYRVWLLFIAGVIAVVIFYLYRSMQSDRRVLKINDIEDENWLTNAEIQKSDNMRIVRYSELGEVADGMPIYSNIQGKDLTVVLANPIHTMVIGTTGSGKTTIFVDPVIQILCRTKTKPSLIVTDPKGEICANHYATLKAQGYDVIVLDLAKAYSSARWNPFGEAIVKTREIKECMNPIVEEDIKIEQKYGKYTDGSGVIYPTYEQAMRAALAAKLTFRGTTYKDVTELNNARAVRVQELTDEVFISIQDVIHTICPITSKSEPTWEEGARAFILGIAVAMWEDLRDGIMDEREFNLHTLYENISAHAAGDDQTLIGYLTRGRGDHSKAAGLAGTVLAAADSEKTYASYISQVHSYIMRFVDGGIRRITAESDIDVSSFDEKPTALFIKIPDEKINRHFMAQLFITQAYKLLVEKARQNEWSGATKDGRLKRNVYVIMDEFGNLPKFDNIKNIVAVGRSRHIYFCPIIQNYAQLDSIYGKEDAETLKTNCNITVYIGTTELKTAEEISTKCGKTKIRRTSLSDGTGSSGLGSASTSAESKPLVTPPELLQWNSPPDKVGNALVLQFGKSPFRSTMTPVYKALELYGKITGKREKQEDELFDENKYFFNFASRDGFFASVEDNELEQNRLYEEIIAAAKAGGKADNGEASAGEDPPKPEDVLKTACERFYADAMKLRKQLPAKLGNALEWAFYDGNAQTAVDVLDQVLGYAVANAMRWVSADAAKLKNRLLMIMAREDRSDEQTDTDEDYEEKEFSDYEDDGE